MGWKEFAASVIGDVLAWPVMFLVVVLILRRPIVRLIGRIKNAKGMGAEVEFEMESLDNSTETALEEASNRVDQQSAQAKPPTGPEEEPADEAPSSTPDAQKKGDQSGRDATEAAIWRIPSEGASKSTVAAILRGMRSSADPSGAVISAWEALLEVLIELNVLTRGPGRPTRNPRKIIDQLSRVDGVTESFIDSVESLFAIRNEVAHGETVPTPGVAKNYVSRARQIGSIAQSLIAAKMGPQASEAAE